MKTVVKEMSPRLWEDLERLLGRKGPVAVVGAFGGGSRKGKEPAI